MDSETERETADETQHISAYLSSVNAEPFHNEDGISEEKIDVAIDKVNRRLPDFDRYRSG